MDIATEDKPIHIREVCKQFRQPNGKPRSLNTVIRWIIHGTKVRGSKELIRLEAKRVGGSWYTTEDAIRKFSESLTRLELESSPMAKKQFSPSKQTLKAKRNRERNRQLKKQKLRSMGL